MENSDSTDLTKRIGSRLTLFGNDNGTTKNVKGTKSVKKNCELFVMTGNCLLNYQEAPNLQHVTFYQKKNKRCYPVSFVFLKEKTLRSIFCFFLVVSFAVRGKHEIYEEIKEQMVTKTKKENGYRVSFWTTKNQTLAFCSNFFFVLNLTLVFFF